MAAAQVRPQATTATVAVGGDDGSASRSDAPSEKPTARRQRIDVEVARGGVVPTFNHMESLLARKGWHSSRK